MSIRLLPEILIAQFKQSFDTRYHRIAIMTKFIICLALLFAVAYPLEGVVELNDDNFRELVHAEPKFWMVMFSASWCGHCTQLKPEIEKVAPLLAELGVSVGHVGEDNRELVDQFVVDHKTHMVSYPKLKVFLGEEEMEGVPPGLRTAPQILSWFRTTFGLGETQL